jgi:toxin ParE1/3/4
LGEHSGLTFVLSRDAKRDIAAILQRSRREFGAAARLRYETLISQALKDIAADPERPGSQIRPDIVGGARTYHLQFSRNRVAGDRVRTPRHILVYRERNRVVEVGRVLHDARDLPNHLVKSFRSF